LFCVVSVVANLKKREEEGVRRVPQSNDSGGNTSLSQVK
jgi:hypothetical protein